MFRALLGIKKIGGNDKKKMETTDPYEQQLLAVFESCDDYCQNSLSSAGLYQLCEKLQLEDHYHKLLKCVHGDKQSGRISFSEFKDGLLKLLNNSDCLERNDRSTSPALDASPKSTLGRKKYGRRSRPENAENESHVSDEGDDNLYGIQSCSTDDDNASEKTFPKKRKTRSNKRKDHENHHLEAENKSLQSILNPVTCTVNEEECLITAWSNVSRGIKNSLNKDELVNVFQCVGLQNGSEEAAQRVFEKLELEETGSITLQELLEFIRSGVGWSKEVRNEEVEAEPCQKNTTFDYVEQSALGCVTGSYIVEQWESAGVPGASQLLHKLGLSESQQLDVSSLITLLSEEFKLLNEDKTTKYLDPGLTGLLSISVLQNVYVQSLKSLIEHMNAEKDKLRNDVIEANQRALLLAQEIDDHHSKLEHSTQQQVKILEQRHTEKIRDLTQQLKSEQDSQACHISMLETKVSNLEEERNKCKTIIMQLVNENETLEQEHRVVMDQLADLQKVKKKLESDLNDLSSQQQKATEMEATENNNEIMSLMERIHALESENTSLRDRNDELSMEVEELSAKLFNASIKKRCSPVNSLTIVGDECMEESSFVGGGTKRRGESFELIESAEDSGGEEGSPRLGKVRKCSPVKVYPRKNSIEGLQTHGVDRGETVEDVPLEMIPSSSTLEEARFGGGHTRGNISFSQELQQIEKEERTTVKDKMKLLEEKLVRLDESQSKELMGHVKDLMNAFRDDQEKCKNCIIKDRKIKENEEEMKRNRDDLEEQTKSLGERCKNLEASLELLKEEYEKTEDYWTEKLEDERNFFEEEQKLSDKKYTELIDKIIEYEEMLGAERNQRQRLETIDEKDGFEKQVMDLEQECYDLRTQFDKAIKEKELEIEMLKKEIKTGKELLAVSDASVQVPNEMDTDSMRDTCKKFKNHSRRSLTFSSGDRKHRCGSCHQQNGEDVAIMQDSKKQLEREIESLVSEREIIYKEVIDKRRQLSTPSINDDSVSSRFNEMEEKCHSLMVTLRNQQKQTEEILNNTWKQHKMEVKDLKSVLKLTEDKLKRQTEVIQEQLSKLARTDLLVKDLFVENAYLTSSVQKLEKKCQAGKVENVTV